MNCVKRISAFLLVIIIFTLSLPTATVFAADPDMRYGRKKLGEMSNGANFQYIYDKLVTGCADASPEIKMDISGRGIDFNNDINMIYKMFYSDYPEYFWINGSWSASMEQRGSTITLTMKPTYTMSGSALTTAKSKYNSKVNELTSGLSGSQYDKAKTLHDRLIDTVTYTNTPNDQNSYGALVEGKAVCNGYARAYQHLMNKVGIPTWYVKGTSNNPSTGLPIGHAWNLVEIDGQWYYTDVTWDDQGAKTYYTYFNITTAQLLEGHTIDSDFASLVPKATATAANYYVKEDRLFSSYDQAKLVNLLKKDNNKTQIYATDGAKSFMSALDKNLIPLAEDLGAKGNYTVSYNYSTLGNALIIDIIIVSESHTHKPKTTVPQVNASCLANGKKAYYICDCGLKFLDSNCTQQITSDSQLEIKASAHTPSDFKNDASNHWKECTVCGSEIAGTRGEHKDDDKDNKCDICTYALPVTDSSGNTVIDGGTASTEEPNNQNITSSDPIENDTQNNDQPTQNTEIHDETDKSNNAPIKLILICGGAVIVVAGIALTIVLISKNKVK